MREREVGSVKEEERDDDGVGSGSGWLEGAAGAGRELGCEENMRIGFSLVLVEVVVVDCWSRGLLGLEKLVKVG